MYASLATSLFVSTRTNRKEDVEETTPRKIFPSGINFSKIVQNKGFFCPKTIQRQLGEHQWGSCKFSLRYRHVLPKCFLFVCLFVLCVCGGGGVGGVWGCVGVCGVCVFCFCVDFFLNISIQFIVQLIIFRVK